MRARLALIALFLFAAAMLIVPLAAQDSVVDDGDLTIVTGAVSFGADGSIIVAGIIIAPASAFNPSMLREGDLVIITGVLLNETTLQAITLEFFEDDPAEVTPEPTPEATPEATPEMTPEATLEVTPEVTPEPTYATCGNLDHPVAARVAERFGVPVEEVIALHCAGNGYGNIIRAYTLAELADDGSTAADFLARHQAGEGWGEIMRDSDVDRSELAPGQVLKQNRDEDASDDAGSADDQGDKGKGQGDNGEDKGKGGNGNGDDKGKGGNGNGEDKGKGQGGNGDDKGKGKGG